jgi:ribosomal protein L11 methyltransferase
MQQAYTQITFHAEFTTHEWLEIFIDECSEAGALAVSMQDANVNTQDEHAIYGEPGCEVVTGWLQSDISVILDADLPAQVFLENLQTNSCLDKLPAYDIEHLPAQDWVSSTQNQFEPIHINGILSICPSWYIDENKESIHNNNAKHVIQLDPGLGFGTGKHATTYLCLDWLTQHITAHQNQACSLLDYGCGSGILAIAAAKLGANKVVGVDIDAQAIESSMINAQNNQVNIEFYTTANIPINTFSAGFDIVMANILCNPLQQLCTQLCGYVNTNGHLVLSGILSSQIQEIKNTYAPYIELNVWKIQEDWVCLVGKKTNIV